MRLGNAAPLLSEKYRLALDREAAARWEAEAAGIETEVAQAADLFREIYPSVSDRLAKLFGLIKNIDAKVDRARYPGSFTKETRPAGANKGKPPGAAPQPKDESWADIKPLLPW